MPMRNFPNPSMILFKPGFAKHKTRQLGVTPPCAFIAQGGYSKHLSYDFL
jgi:hypothetical protein